MHQKMIQFHILDSFYDNMSFLMFKVESLFQKNTKNLFEKNMDPNGSENMSKIGEFLPVVFLIVYYSYGARRREKRPAQ